MINILSYCRNPKKLLIFFYDICLTFAVALGLIAIIATGGGGDGDGGDGDNDPCDYNSDIDCGDGEYKYCTANTGNPANITILNDKLIFTAFSGCKNIVSTTMFELDNAGAINEIFEFGSYNLDDQDPPFTISYPQDIRALVTIDNVAYFSWMTNLYKYDGVNPVQMIDEGIAYGSLMAYNDKLYYTVFNSSGPPGLGGSTVDFYYYDGSAPVPVGEISGTLTSYTVYNGKLYFFVNEDLWCYDENTAALSLVSDMENSLIGLTSNLIIYQDKLYFNADDGVNGNQLRMVDSENNVSMITNMAKVNTFLDSFVSPLEVFQGKLLCLVYESEDLQRLWAYDGNDISPIPVDGPYTYVKGGTILNDRYYFLGPETAGVMIDLAVLWSYDGLNAPVKIGTSEYLRDIFPYGSKLLLRTEERLLIYDGISQPEAFAELGDPVLDAVETIINYNDNYYITGESEEYGNELWKIDNSGIITLVEDFYPGVACSCENDE